MGWTGPVSGRSHTVTAFPVREQRAGRGRWRSSGSASSDVLGGKGCHSLAPIPALPPPEQLLLSETRLLRVWCLPPPPLPPGHSLTSGVCRWLLHPRSRFHARRPGISCLGGMKPGPGSGPDQAQIRPVCVCKGTFRKIWPFQWEARARRGFYRTNEQYSSETGLVVIRSFRRCWAPRQPPSSGGLPGLWRALDAWTRLSSPDPRACAQDRSSCLCSSVPCSSLIGVCF